MRNLAERPFATERMAVTDTPIYDQINQELGFSESRHDATETAPRPRRQSGARAAGSKTGVSVWALIDEHKSTPTGRHT